MYRTCKYLVLKSAHLDVRTLLLPSYNFCRVRFFCSRNQGDKNEKNTDKSTNLNIEESVQPGLGSKYKVFQDIDAPILLDVYEEKMMLKNEISLEINQMDEFSDLNLERGVRGVFEIEDLVELLRRDKAEDIFVAELPPEARYVDYIVVVTGRSRRHMIALAEIVRRVFKKKRFSSDIIPKIEGENSSLWMAMDLGNIALHIFSQDARNMYDLECLWSVGTEYDSLSNSAEDPLVALLKKHSIPFNDIHVKGQLL